MKKVLFYILFAIVTFVVTLVLLSQRLSDDYRIELDVMIRSTPEVVFQQVSDLKNWPSWSPWKKKDPTLEFIFEEGKTTAVGDVVKWTSQKSGNGSLTITESSHPTVLEYQLQFDDWSEHSVGEIHLIKMVDDVRVVWTLHGRRGFVDKIFWTLFKLEEVMKTDMSEGLLLLKSATETAK